MATKSAAKDLELLGKRIFTFFQVVILPDSVLEITARKGVINYRLFDVLKLIYNLVNQLLTSLKQKLCLLKQYDKHSTYFLIMNSEQQPFEQPSSDNPFVEMDSQQIARIMQQNFKDPENANNSLNSQLEHFVAVASDIIAFEKVLEPNRDFEIAKARTIINAHWPVPPSKSIKLEELSVNAPIILAKLENQAGCCLNDQQKKQALALIRSLQLDFLTTVEDVIDEMLEVPSLKHFAELLKACSDQ